MGDDQSLTPTPASIDWRNYNGKNYVTPVINNQTVHVSASVLVSLANITCSHAIVTGKMTALSIEQI